MLAGSTYESICRSGTLGHRNMLELLSISKYMHIHVYIINKMSGNRMNSSYIKTTKHLSADRNLKYKTILPNHHHHHY